MFCISVVQNPLFTSLQISDEPYLFLRIITLFTSLTNQSSPLQRALKKSLFLKNHVLYNCL